MEKTKQIEQLRLAAEILEKGLEWEYFWDRHYWPSTTRPPQWHVARNEEIRIKPKTESYNKYEKALKEGASLYFKIDGDDIWREYTYTRSATIQPGDDRCKWGMLTKKTVPLQYNDYFIGQCLIHNTKLNSVTVVNKNNDVLFLYGQFGTFEKWCVREVSYAYISKYYKRIIEGAAVPCNKLIEEIDGII